LQQAAEQGVPGALLMAGLASWGFLALAAARRPPPVAAVGAAAFSALVVHASVDYILHFPAVPLAAAALLGAASARCTWSRSPSRSPRERPGWAGRWMTSPRSSLG
jgi:hypothetical protein